MPARKSAEWNSSEIERGRRTGTETETETDRERERCPDTQTEQEMSKTDTEDLPFSPSAGPLRLLPERGGHHGLIFSIPDHWPVRPCGQAPSKRGLAVAHGRCPSHMGMIVTLSFSEQMARAKISQSSCHS